MVIEDFEEDSEAEGSGGEDDIRELRAKKLALARKIAEQQRRQEKIQVRSHWRSWWNMAIHEGVALQGMEWCEQEWQGTLLLHSGCEI